MEVDHFLYVNVGSRSAEEVETEIVAELGALGFDTQVKAKIIKNWKRPDRNFGYVWVEDLEAWNRLLGRHADGSPRIRIIDPEDNAIEACELPGYDEWRAKLNRFEAKQAFDPVTSEWGWYENERAKIRNEFVKEIKDTTEIKLPFSITPLLHTSGKPGHFLKFSTSGRIPSWVTMNDLLPHIEPFLTKDELKQLNFHSSEFECFFELPMGSRKFVGISQLIYELELKETIEVRCYGKLEKQAVSAKLFMSLDYPSKREAHTPRATPRRGDRRSSQQGSPRREPMTPRTPSRNSPMPSPHRTPRQAPRTPPVVTAHELSTPRSVRIKNISPPLLILEAAPVTPSRANLLVL